jgi:hypothetical protein
MSLIFLNRIRSTFLVSAVLAFSFTGCVSKPALDDNETRKGVYSAVGAHMKEFERCYLKAIDESPGARGKLVANWQVNDLGFPLFVNIKESDPSLKAAEACVVSILSLMRFPKAPASEEIDIIYPFYFSENGKFGPSAEKK